MARRNAGAVPAELNDERIDLEDEADTEPIHEEFADPSEDDDEDGAFAELDAALAAEEAEEPETSERRLFRRRP